MGRRQKGPRIQSTSMSAAEVRMRRMMLAMSQGKSLAMRSVSLFSRFQKIRKRAPNRNRKPAGCSKISHIPAGTGGILLRGARPNFAWVDGWHERGHPPPPTWSDFLATSEGLSLTKAFMRIKEAQAQAPHCRPRRGDCRRG